MKIAINRCYGGFRLSHEALMLYAKLAGIEIYPYIHDLTTDIATPLEGTPDNDSLIPLVGYSLKPIVDGKISDDDHFSSYDLQRHDHLLIRAIEQLGKKANGGCVADIHIVEVPDDIEYTIEEYDGIEWVAEKHRTWE